MKLLDDAVAKAVEVSPTLKELTETFKLMTRTIAALAKTVKQSAEDVIALAQAHIFLAKNVEEHTRLIEELYTIQITIANSLKEGSKLDVKPKPPASKVSKPN